MAIRRNLIAGLAVLLGSMLSFAVQASAKLNMRPGVTETSLEAYDLHMTVIVVMTVIAAVVFGAMFYSIFAHRKSKNPTPATFSHSTLVEVVWTAIPVLILIGLTIPAVKLLIKMEDASNADMTVVVTGSQWKWHYRYQEHEIDFYSNLKSAQQRENFNLEAARNNPNYLLEVDNELVLPANKKVRFLMTSEDVIHSWWVPEIAVKKDAIPGFINETWTQVPQEGTYRGQCTELCGQWHGFMPVVVKVVSESQFDQWIATKKEQKLAAEKAAAEAAAKSWDMDKLMELGKTVYEKNCALCHQPNGEGAGTFPALKGSPIATGPAVNHISIVVNGKVAMPSFGKLLSDAELAAVITYERNAWGNNTGDKVQPADIMAFKAGN